MADLLKVGERVDRLSVTPIPSQAKSAVADLEGVETGWAAPNGRKVNGEGTVQTTNTLYLGVAAKAEVV